MYINICCSKDKETLYGHVHVSTINDCKDGARSEFAKVQLFCTLLKGGEG